MPAPRDPDAPRVEPGPAPLDHQRLFQGLPTAYLVMTPDLVIAEANEAYLELLGRTREDLIGRPVFEAFPPSPDALDEAGRNPLQTSFERARDTGRPDALPLFRYSVSDTATGEVVERWWSLISAPLLDEDGRTAMVLQRVEDVTDYVREQAGRRAEVARGRAWRERVQAVEADLYLRLQQLRDAQDAKDVAARRLARLGEVALELTTAETVEDLERIVVGRGLGLLGADGGAVVSADEHGGWRVTVSAVLGDHVQLAYGRLPHDSPLPAPWAARTGQRVLLPTREAGLAFSPAMAEVYADTRRLGWAFLPLTARGRVLGSLAVSWADEHPLEREEVDLLESFAAQTAQALDRLLALEAERRAARAVARMSETLQRSLLTEPPQLEHLQIAVRYAPAAQEAQVGGDWYDAFVSREGVASLVIGDVSGHDRDAAAAMAQLRNLLRGIGYATGAPPSEVLSSLDGAMRDLRVDALATLVLAQVHRDHEGHGHGSQLLRWSSAGHLPPVLLHPDGAAELLDTDPDLLVGLLPGTERSDHEVVLEPGATVLLYTDGLVERRGAPLEQGLDWLAGAAQELAGLPLEGFCDALLAQLPDDVEDDIALLALRAGPRPAP